MKKRIFLVLYQVSVLFIFSFCLFSQNNLNDKIHIDKKWDRINDLKASFFYYPTLPVTGQEIRFFDASSGNPDNKYWNFGDGHISTEKNPIHAYNSPNIYYVSLQIMKGDAISIENRYILVRTTSNTDSQKPKADFIFEPENPQVGVPVRFYDKSSGNPDKRIWQFGYFSFSFLKDPVKTFLMNKKYAITLTVKNQYGEDKCTKYIDIQQPPKNIIVANSCSLKDVQAAIAQASPADTVVVPDGNATWSNQLVINKGIILKAQTKGGVKITSSYSHADDLFDPASYLIVYNPSSPANNEPFRLSGFEFELNSQVMWLYLKNATLYAVNKIRIDNNTVKHSRHYAIHIYGTVYGVADNNSVVNNVNGGGIFRCNGLDSTTWNNLTFDFGTADNFYFEDNNITGASDSLIVYGEMGCRYCMRYNTIDATGSTNGLYPAFDMHGNQPNAHNATMGAEIYGNVIYCNQGVSLVDQRGGKAIVYDNNIITNASVMSKVREEYLDSLNPPAYNPAGQPQHVSSSYYWNLMKNGVVLYIDNPYVGETVFYNDLGRNVPLEDVDFWRHKSSFDGSSGVGVGLLSQRPVSCAKEGVGWWATDQHKLYRWHNGQWELYYIPYLYPHPLRNILCD